MHLHIKVQMCKCGNMQLCTCKRGKVQICTFKYNYAPAKVQICNFWYNHGTIMHFQSCIGAICTFRYNIAHLQIKVQTCKYAPLGTVMHLKRAFWHLVCTLAYSKHAKEKGENLPLKLQNIVQCTF